MSYQAATLVVMCLAMSPVVQGSSAGFLRERHAEQLNGSALAGSLQRAMDTVLGCGEEVGHEELSALRQKLLPMWNVLPKNAEDRIERRSIRYLAHRYFMSSSSLLVRGLEYSRSSEGAASLSQRVPFYVESVFEGKEARRGFTFEDAVNMVAFIEQLLFDSESDLLGKVYGELGIAHNDIVPARGNYTGKNAQAILERYIIRWMMGDDEESIKELIANRKMLENQFPHWDGLSAFIKGQAHSLVRNRQLMPVKGRGRDTWAQQFTYDDIHRVAWTMTREFGSFWQSECNIMKDILIGLDPDMDGRVSLSKFYGYGVNKDWRFAESEQYLRNMGALDESSSWRGKQVIISNYIQAASNCIVTTQHYLVCCRNECEAVMGEIEGTIGEPLASPAQILDIVNNMTVTSRSLDEDDVKLPASMINQLAGIADIHGGKVPLHGRLFEQWLHYAFPYECQFPYKSEHKLAITPSEFGADYVASEQEMRRVAALEDETLAEASGTDASTEAVAAGATAAEQEILSQWSHEEELISDYAGQLRAPWETHHTVLGTLSIVALAGAILLLVVGKKGSDVSKVSDGNMWASKAHLV